MHIPSPHQNSSRKRVRGPGIWGTYPVHYILKNETYAGTWHWGKRIGKGGYGGNRPIEEQVAVEVTAIVSREEWLAVQERRQYNKRMAKRNCQRQYLLRGMIRCGACNHAMAGSYHTVVKRTYYRCWKGSNYHPGLETRCRQQIHGEHIDLVTWNYVISLMTDKTRFEQHLREARQQELAAIQPTRDRLKLVESLISGSEVETSNLAASIAQVPLGV